MIHEPKATHVGRYGDHVFFVAAPPELGALALAYTDCPRRVATMNRGLRIALAALVVAMGIAGGVVAAIMVKEKAAFLVKALLIAGPPLLSFALAAFLVRSFHVIYVGEHGYARYSLRMGGGQASRCDALVRFDEVGHLVRNLTRKMLNGEHVGMSFDFRFFDRHGARLDRVSGSFDGMKELSDAIRSKHKDERVDHAAMTIVERLWTAHAARRGFDQLASEGGVLFPIVREDRVVGTLRLAPGSLTVTTPKGVAAFAEGELKKVSFKDGTLEILDDAFQERLFGSTGRRVRLPADEIGNCAYFATALPQLVLPQA